MPRGGSCAQCVAAHITSKAPSGVDILCVWGLSSLSRIRVSHTSIYCRSLGPARRATVSPLSLSVRRSFLFLFLLSMNRQKETSRLALGQVSTKVYE